MKKTIIISTMFILSAAVFTGCTKTTGDSASSINPSITVETPINTETAETPTLPALNEGNTLQELEQDLNSTDFSDIDIEIDSSL